jgi:uncharacterized phage protein gp47/JayE
VSTPNLPPGTIATSPVLQVPTALDYTSKDFLSLAQSMLGYGSIIMPDWNQASEGDFGVALVEMFAYMGDILSYYGDRISQEAYLPTATQRLSLLNIAQLLGYTVSNGVPATGTVTFQTSSTSAAIDIQPGTQVATAFQVSTNSPIIYETTLGATCPGAGGTVTVPVSQGITYTMQPVGTTTGLPGQVVQLPQTGIIDGSVSIYVQTTAGSQQWNYMQYLVDAGPDDMVWTSYIDANGFTNIEFGDNINGLVPSIGLIVWATFTVGAGAAGNQAAGVVGMIVSTVDGLFVAVNAGGTYQSSPMTGGADPESNDHIRASAPASFQTQNRAVAPQDFQNLVLAIPGVMASNVVANHSTSVTLYVLGPGFQPPSTGLAANIISFFESRTLAGVSVTVGTPSLVPFNVGASGSGSNYVQVQAKDGYLAAHLTANVQAALTNLFQPPSASFGQLITLSLIMQAIMSVPGVAWCSVPQFTRTDVVQTTTASIQLRASEIAVPGTFYVTVNGGL